MALREDRIGQAWLVPLCVIDFIPEIFVFFIANLVEELDSKKIDQK